MKRISWFIQIALAVFLFLLIPASRNLFIYGNSSVLAAPAPYLEQNYATDTDNAIKNQQVSLTPITEQTSFVDMHWLTCHIITYYYNGPYTCTQDETIYKTSMKSSALGNIAMGINTMYENPPADLAYWVQDTAQSLGIAPRQVYAQGIGFTGLAPLLPVWKAFRNIAYLVLALAMIVIGFMVMLRKKIDPKTVVTVQNSIPRIVIALILITFSYAIVGLFIDVMYLLMGFLSIVVQGALPNTTLGKSLIPINFSNPGFVDLIRAVLTPAGEMSPSTSMINDFYHGDVLGGLLNMIGTGIFYGTGIGFIFMFIITIAYLIAFIRILMMLLNSYVQILLAVLTGPLQILVDVFPGADGFTSWVKNLAANLIVFPVTALLLMVADVITQYTGSQTLWTPPFLPQTIYSGTLPVVGNVTVGGMGGLAEGIIALGIVLAIPSIVNGIKEALKAKPLISSGLDVVGGQVKGAFPIALQLGGMALQHQQMSQFGKMLGQGKEE